jgi:hypothetical protein
MNQAVITFSNSTARGSAIASPVEGMLTYLEDTQTYESWDGAAWVAFGGGASAGTQNAIINGAFEINQRNFSSSTATGYGFDRWSHVRDGDGTSTCSSQAFTPGSGPTGYESANFLRLVTTGQTSSSASSRISQEVEDVRSFAGETVTLSFFAKAASGSPKIAVEAAQRFGTGGSPSSAVIEFGGQVTLGTSWTRHSLTFTVPSISGKTIGTDPNSSSLSLRLYVSAGSDLNARTGSLGIQSNTFDIWGVQLEAGSEATSFRRNANSIQGELAACQRYYVRFTSDSIGEQVGVIGGNLNQSIGQAVFPTPTTLRVGASSIDFSNVGWLNFSNITTYSGGTITLLSVGNSMGPSARYTHGSNVLAAGNSGAFANTSTTAFIGFSAEL